MSDINHTHFLKVYTAAASVGKALPTRSAPVHQ